jgi:ribosome biogenesis ATPase
LKKRTDENAGKPENDKTMVVEIIEEGPPEDIEKSTNEESSGKEASNERSSNKEPLNMDSLNKKASKKESGVSVESIVNSECSSDEILELRAWLHDSQCPLSDEQLNELHVELDDFKQALKCVQPSAKREGFATVPGVTWDDVGSLRNIREELQMTILVSNSAIKSVYSKTSIHRF